MTTQFAKPLPKVLERELAHMLFSLRHGIAPTLGWRSYRITDSRGTLPGYPDQTCWRERLIFVELKTEKGGPTASQAQTLTELTRAGQEVYLVRPSDVPVFVRDVLTPRGPLNSLAPPPGCRWHSGGHRWDEA